MTFPILLHGRPIMLLDPRGRTVECRERADLELASVVLAGQ